MPGITFNNILICLIYRLLSDCEEDNASRSSSSETLFLTKILCTLITGLGLSKWNFTSKRGLKCQAQATERRTFLVKACSSNLHCSTLLAPGGHSFDSRTLFTLNVTPGLASTFSGKHLFGLTFLSCYFRFGIVIA